MSRDERLRRAHEILKNPDLKQAICNQILGTTHKDVERAMISLIEERKLTAAQIEQMELEELAPEKFDLEMDFKMSGTAAKPKNRYTTYTLEDVQVLIAAGDQPVAHKPKEHIDYPTYTLEDVQRLLKQ